MLIHLGTNNLGTQEFPIDDQPTRSVYYLVVFPILDLAESLALLVGGVLIVVAVGRQYIKPPKQDSSNDA